MRYTVRNTVMAGRPCRIFCDGEPVPFASAADDEEGWVEFVVTDADGKFVVRGADLQMDRRYGAVHVEPIPTE